MVFLCYTRRVWHEEQNFGGEKIYLLDNTDAELESTDRNEGLTVNCSTHYITPHSGVIINYFT